jgi:hypothetical protein
MAAQHLLDVNLRFCPKSPLDIGGILFDIVLEILQTSEAN